MRAMIFGLRGQDGYYLNILLNKFGVEVIGVSRIGEGVAGDVADFLFVSTVIKRYAPDYIFHFSANSSTRHDVMFDNHAAISTGTLNILESVKLFCPNCKVFLSGSAMQFLNDGTPIAEDRAFSASSPYSVARIQSVYAGRYFRSTFGLQVYVGYFFNHDSPLRSEQHVNQKIAQAAKRISKGSQERLVLGNVEVRKEFNFAGDFVEAIWILVNQNSVFETVIGCGEARSIKEWTQYCFAQMGLEYENHVSERLDFVPEYQTLVSNPKLVFSLGWRPKVHFHQLANMMLEAK